ncbi:MAG: ferric reductase-like transmembrane domain-containing protein [Chloroflexota bacterium]
MSGRWAVPVLAALLLILGAGSALAENAAANGPRRLTGQAVIVQTRPPRLLLSANAADGSGWRLDLNVQPNGAQTAGDGNQLLLLAGTYTLSGPGVSATTGPASGQLDEQGTGQFQLGSPASGLLKTGSPGLTATFKLDPSGPVQVELTGPLPAPPAPVPTGPVDHTFWYVARAAGFSAYALLTLTVCFGLLVRTKLMDALLARWRTFDVHQVTALIALAFVGLHIFALLGDQYVGFQLKELFVPFTAPYRPTEVALGIVALYLMVVIVGSFYVRRSIGYETWRAIHYLTFGAFLLALGHGVLAGTDSGEIWARAIYGGTGLLVGALTWWRVRRDANRHRPEQRPIMTSSSSTVSR